MLYYTFTGPVDSNDMASCSMTIPELTKLQQSVYMYYCRGLAVSTQKLYRAGQARYHSFCNQLRCQPIPFTEEVLLLFVAHLANE